jgi:RNA polymerase sigma-70 factor, ECF subfamily
MKNALTGSGTIESSEREAITRAQRGDGVGFEYLYKKYSRRVYSVCLRMTRNSAEAEDLTQQTFLQVFRKIGTFRGESGFSTWLHRVTVNIVLMHLRRRKRTEVLLEDLNHPGSDNEAPREFGASDTSMFGAIDRLNLRRAIRKLPSGYKRFFLLYDVLGYEHHEIAQRLGCSTGCSKSQLHRARKQLRRLLQGERCVAREADVAAA